jgi:hypothetical protein
MKKPKTRTVLMIPPIQHETAIRQAAESTRDLWKYRKQHMNRDRDVMCADLRKRLSVLGIETEIVKGFYAGSESAGFHTWLEGTDFLVDVSADTFNKSPVYVAHISQARDSYKRD